MLLSSAYYKNPQEKDSADIEIVNWSGVSTEQALSKSRVKKPPTCAIIYLYSVSFWAIDHMQNLREYFKWCDNKCVTPTLWAMLKMIDCYQKKGIEMLKLGFTLPNFSKKFLQKSTHSKFYPFTETDKGSLEKNTRRYGWRTFRSLH